MIAPSARLDAWLPDASFSDTIVVASSATRGPLMKALEELTLAEMPLARLLGAIRHLPARLAGGEAAKRARADAARPFLPMVSSGRGSLVLERAEDEIVLGTVGKLHQIRDQEPAEVRTPAEFRTFGVPNHERLAMSIRVVSAEGEAFLVLEHRTSPTDAIAEQRFARYWLAIRPGGAFVTRQLLRAVARRAERGASA